MYITVLVTYHYVVEDIGSAKNITFNVDKRFFHFVSRYLIVNFSYFVYERILNDADWSIICN